MRPCSFFLLAGSVALWVSGSSLAGVIEINQARAEAGGVNGSLVSDPPGFPVVISEPGSYRLTSDLTKPFPAKHVISILVDDVTLDLGGFTLRAPEPVLNCLPSSDGIAGAGQNITIRNGRIRQTSVGISITGAGARVEHVEVTGPCEAGVRLGESALVEGAIVSQTGGRGIECGNFCRVSNSTSYSNLSTGIRVGTDGIVTGSIAADVGGSGAEAGAGTLVVYNTASLNGVDGITAGNATNLIGNVSNQNERDGIAGTDSSAAAWNEIDGNFRDSLLGTLFHGCNVVRAGRLSCRRP
jgi:hypothetical protein